MKTISKTRIIAECAIMVALGTILANIKIYELPFGGSVTLVSMLPFILVSLRHGAKWGLLTGLVNSFLQMAIGFWAPPANTFIAFAGVVLLDYVLAFSLLGIACMFRKLSKNDTLGVAIAVCAVCFIRFMCSFLSGALLWGSYQSYYEWANGLSVWTYSLIYNGSYMIPEMIITTIVAIILCKKMPEFFAEQK